MSKANFGTSEKVIAAAAAGLALLSSVAHAAEFDPTKSPINGFWNIDEAFRRDAQAKIHAELTPAGEEIAKRNREVQAARIARGEVVGLGSFTCGLQGVPFVIGTSEPWLLVANKDVVVQVMERRMMTPRYFYTDGRTLPDVSTLPPSSSGYSVAHWEGGDLLIDTRGLPSGGIQGGGLKGPNTTLHERVSVNPAGNRLTWTYTWEDPTLLAKPLTYSIEYDRADKNTYAFVYECDPNENPGLTVSNPEQEQGAAR